MKALRWLDDHFEEMLISVIICIIACLMMAQIILRGVFKTSLPWSDETCRYLFIWAAALGISFATKSRAQLRMDILPNVVKKLQVPLEVLCDLALFMLSIYLMKPGYSVLIQLAKTGQKAASTHVPMYWIYTSMFVGFGLTILRIIEHYIKLLVSRCRTGKKEEA